MNIWRFTPYFDEVL